jgi:hypothetical protein
VDWSSRQSSELRRANNCSRKKISRKADFPHLAL